RSLALVLVAFLFACPAAARPQGEPQPDRLHLGTVYVGAAVEASFLLREPGDNPDIKPGKARSSRSGSRCGGTGSARGRPTEPTTRSCCAGCCRRRAGSKEFRREPGNSLVLPR